MELHPTLLCKFGSDLDSKLISLGKDIVSVYLKILMGNRGSCWRQLGPTDKLMESTNNNGMFLLSLKNGRDIGMEK